MTLNQICEKHGGSFVLAVPLMRDALTKRVESWKVIQTVKKAEDLEKALEYYELEGFSGVVSIPVFSPDDSRLTEYPARLAAKFWLSYLGLCNVAEGGT